jgi:hypothetical protein
MTIHFLIAVASGLGGFGIRIYCVLITMAVTA